MAWWVLACTLALLQADLATSAADSCPAGKPGCGNRKHFWPHARGQVGGLHGYSVTNLTGPSDLSKPSYQWFPGQTRFRSVVLCGPLIDDEKMFYVMDVSKVYKLTSEGKLVWEFQPPWPGGLADCPSLSPGSELFGRSISGHNWALDIETGKMIWSSWTGVGSGDTSYIENHDGVIVSEHGAGNERVVAIRADDGGHLWEFRPDQSVWNLMPLFPGDDTVVFQDIDGRVYKLGLHNGTLIWKNGGRHWIHPTWTDGGCMLGPSNMVYAASSKGLVAFHHKEVGGGVHAYRLDTGELVWQKHLQRPFFTWPVVGKLPGRETYSVIVAVGGNAFFAWQLMLHNNLKEHIFDPGLLLVLGLVCCCSRSGKGTKCCRFSLYAILAALMIGVPLAKTYMYVQGMGGMPIDTFEADIFAFDAETGEQQWRHRLPEWPYISAAGDGEGYLERSIHVPQRTLCLPASYNAPTIDSRGTVWIGYMDGRVLGLRDEDMDGEVAGEKEVLAFDTKGSFLHSGPAFAPGLMAVTNCDSLWVWKTE